MKKSFINIENLNLIWDKFITREIAINCATKEESNIFLKYCFNKGIYWGDKLEELEQWEYNEAETCYSVYAKARLQYSNMEIEIPVFIFKKHCEMDVFI